MAAAYDVVQLNGDPIRSVRGTTDQSGKTGNEQQGSHLVVLLASGQRMVSSK
jgi:hypothetical protein